MGQNDDLNEINRALRAVDQPLDEVARMRVQGRILAAADDWHGVVQARRPRSSSWRARWWALAALLVVPTAVASLMLLPKPHPKSPTGVAHVLSPIEDGPSFTHLELPAGATIDTRLGSRARIRLTGPAVVDVVSASADLIEIRLPMGVLVGDYDHSRGGTLRIDSPGAITEVVGTRFAIEAAAAGTRVSVAHGRVNVRGARQVVRVVSDQQSWNTQQDSVGTITPEAQRLFQDQPASPPVASARPAKTPTPTPLAAPQRRRALAHRDAIVHAASPAVTKAVRANPESAPIEDLPAAPPVPPPAPAPVVVAPPTDLNEGLYASAEDAMRKGDLPRARAALEQLVRTGSGPVAIAARYDLARLAARAGERNLAASILDEMLASNQSSPLREPARFLRCRIDVERGRGDVATACLQRFLQEYPSSVHAASARQMLGGKIP